MNKEECQELQQYLDSAERERLKLVPKHNFEDLIVRDVIKVTANPEDIEDAPYVNVMRFAAYLITRETMLNVIKDNSHYHRRLKYVDFVQYVHYDPNSDRASDVQSWLFEDRNVGR